MFRNALTRRAGAFLFLVLMVSSTLVQARPLQMFAARPDDETEKLPPVNWIRSRKIDTKHIAIDLRFDWEKRQAIGSETITVAPFGGADHFNLDAAMMTISSITTPDGQPLKFNYKGGADNDNLEIDLGRTVKDGEDVTVKINY